MKKYFFLFFVALVSMCAFAQKGQKAVGLNLSYGTEISNLGFGVKGQYNFTDAIRVEASFDYFLKKDDLSMWDVNVNAHYLIPVKDLKIYPLVGLTYTNWKDSFDFGNYLDGFKDYYDDDLELSDSEGKFGVNLGGGVQYDINNNWAVNFEMKYQIISDFDQAVFGFGVTYKF